MFSTDEEKEELEKHGESTECPDTYEYVDHAGKNPTQVEVQVNDQTIKTHRGGGGVKSAFDYMDERHIKVRPHERA